MKLPAIAAAAVTLVLGGWVATFATPHGQSGAPDDGDSPYTEVAKLRPDLPETDQFGNNLSIEEDLLLVGTVGEHGNDGDTAHLFRRAAGEVGVWDEIWIFNPESADEFGWSVDLDGDRAVIQGTETARDKGSVWVFEREEGDSHQWREVAILREQDPVGTTSGLGAPAISGDTIVVGAVTDDELAGDSGAAYVFEWTGDPVDPWRWVKLLAPDGGGGQDWFGTRPDIEGDTIVIGAQRDDERGQGAGAVWVFERQPDGSWKDVAKLMGSDIDEGDRFGSDLALHRDTIAVVSGFGDPQQVVYLFERNAGGPNIWGEVAKLVPSERGIGTVPDVAIEDGIVVLGGESADDGGAAFVFLQEADGAWSEIARLAASDGEFGDSFGESIGISGRIVAVGADRAGAVYVFAESDCVLEVSLVGRSEVSPGGTLEVEIHLEHNRLATVTVPFAVWVENEDGVVLMERTTPPLTFQYGDTLSRELTIEIPEGTPPGRYVVKVGIERMQQGIAAAVQPFRVVGPSVLRSLH